MKYINRHAIVLFIILVVIGFGLFTLMGFQRENAFAPAPTTGGGLVINVLPAGSAPFNATVVNAQGSDATSSPVDDTAAADAAACP